MRRLLVSCAAMMLGCAGPAVGPSEPTPTVPRPSHGEGAEDPFLGAPEMTVIATAIDYPEDPYDSPAGPDEIRSGRWTAQFESLLFRDDETGDGFATCGGDDPMFELRPESFYRSAKFLCFDVTIRAAVSKLPPPCIAGGPWLLIREVIEWKECRCVRHGDLYCAEWAP